MRTEVRILIRGRSLVETGWSQCAAARDAREHLVDPLDDDAVSWCASASLERARHELGVRFSDLSRAMRLFSRASEVITPPLRLGRSSVSDESPTAQTIRFNDVGARSLDEVLAAFDRAIEGVNERN